VDRALSDLAEFPEIGARFQVPFRRKLVPGFYDFGVFYVIEGSRILVHAILNLRQDPEAIRRCLGLDR
jgi:plasmid stabilization system protein ParE